MNVQKPRGTEDLYYKSAKEHSALELIIRSIVEQYNYHEIRTPIFEGKELFVRSIGVESDIVSKEMFELVHKSDREFVLRPEGTAPVVRSILEDKLYGKYELPLKLFYFGPMFRYERPQHGRLRQFNQFGVEAVGTKNYLLDVETILLGYNILKALGIATLKLKLNCLATDENRDRYIIDLKHFLVQEQLCTDCLIRIQKNPLRVLDCKIDNPKFNYAPKIYNYLTESEESYFNSLKNILTKLEINFELDHKLVRGLDYYTSLVYEIIVEEENRELTLVGGGRYDNLLATFDSTVDYPAVGFAMGIERILLTLVKNKLSLVGDDYLDVYIVCLSEHARYFSASLLLLLRGSGLRADCDYLNRGVKAQFKSVERSQATNAIIIGDEELKQNVVKIKNQKSGKEHTVKFEKIITFLSKEQK